MKITRQLLLLTLAVTFANFPGEASAESVQLNVDWSKYMAQQDPVWERLPENYFEGAFVGNGLLGTIVFRDKIQKNSLCFEIGRTDVSTIGRALQLTKRGVGYRSARACSHRLERSPARSYAQICGMPKLVAKSPPTPG